MFPEELLCWCGRSSAMLGYNINIRKGEQLHYCSSAAQLVTRERSVLADIKIFNHSILKTGQRHHRTIIFDILVWIDDFLLKTKQFPAESGWRTVLPGFGKWNHLQIHLVRCCSRFSLNVFSGFCSAAWLWKCYRKPFQSERQGLG